MFLEILQTAWILLPAGIANMAPALFKWVPVLNKPIDLGLKIKNRPLFGKNKTYRGFLFGIIAGVIVVYLQKLVYPVMINYSIIDYNTINPGLLGFLFGFGALFGDLVKSFFKRRVNLKPGAPWIPFDQIDWIIGALVFGGLYIYFPLVHIIIAFIFFGILHIIFNYIGYFTRIKKSKL